MFDGVMVIGGIIVIDALWGVTITRNKFELDEFGGEMLSMCSMISEANDSLDEK